MKMKFSSRRKTILLGQDKEHISYRDLCKRVRLLSTILTRQELGIYMFLLECLGRHDICWPSKQTIARECDIRDMRELRRKIDRLQSIGLIAKFGTRNTPSGPLTTWELLPIDDILDKLENSKGDETLTSRGDETPQKRYGMEKESSHASPPFSIVPESAEADFNIDISERFQNPRTDISILKGDAAPPAAAPPADMIEQIILEWGVRGLPISDVNDTYSTIYNKYSAAKSRLNIRSDADMMWFIKAAIDNSRDFISKAQHIRGPGWLFMTRKSTSSLNLYECLTCAYGGTNRISGLYETMKWRERNGAETNI